MGGGKLKKIGEREEIIKSEIRGDSGEKAERPASDMESEVGKKIERASEKIEAAGAAAEGKTGPEIVSPVIPAVGGMVTKEKKKREKQIEKILEKDLTDVYSSLPPDKQREFKAAGEQTAQEINTILDRTKVKVKQVIAIIKKWLLLLPGVNRFFLEQEAKIKADEIIRLKNNKVD